MVYKVRIHKNNVKNKEDLDQLLDVCPVGVFIKEKGEVIVKYPEKCIGCRSCEATLSNGEVTVEEE
ncbi:ferredoxin [Candidatus Woesearchaeota archaeon]|nr:ferredoxin [Candidatus Woesearchaeota archaeon]